jgi:hypothetical protein
MYENGTCYSFKFLPHNSRLRQHLNFQGKKMTGKSASIIFLHVIYFCGYLKQFYVSKLFPKGVAIVVNKVLTALL